MQIPKQVGAGRPEPLGPSFNKNLANFAIYSSHAEKILLCLFWSGKQEPDLELPLAGPDSNHWHIEIQDVPPQTFYAFRVIQKGQSRLVADPYAKDLNTNWRWGDQSHAAPPFLAPIAPLASFDWQQTKPPRIPWTDLIIYEMHVRGLTQHPSSQANHPGTYLGVIEKIPYFKKLGVNAVELMPVFEFDETHLPNNRINYWGYSPISFFVPMRRFGTILEFKTMVRELHRNGIEVILDVVYNHTGEDDRYVHSFRGIDRSAYYLLDPQGKDLNFTGCGNTVRVHSPPATRVILDSLHYWVQEMGVDGFRFDLASVLTRDANGQALMDPPILRLIAKDPILKDVKLIAEPWDAAGLYQIGQFPRWGKWSAWNGQFRDHVRRFIKGTDGEAGPFATMMCGCEPCYGINHSPQSSINFITAHDGFCLNDLVSFQQKHNLANGEDNRDGSNQNDNWNCGCEGATNDPAILALRERQKRNFLLALFLSQGVPMLLMGDEASHTRQGNNNPYTQDNDLNWLNWSRMNQSVFQFVSALIAFRAKLPCFKHTSFLTDNDIEWHGTAPRKPNWSPASRFVAFSFKQTPSIYVAFNADYKPAHVALPADRNWKLVVDTAQDWDKHRFNNPTSALSIYDMLPYSAIVGLCDK